jgi:hypothetical protein
MLAYSVAPRGRDAERSDAERAEVTDSRPAWETTHPLSALPARGPRGQLSRSGSHSYTGASSST